jgi:CBS domain-containing protein
MVNNPAWRKTLPEFKKMVSGWCYSPSPESMMNLAIFIDAKPVAGDAALLDEVKAHLQKTMINDAGMLMAFARSVELFDGHSRGFFSQLLSRGQNEKMDIKKMGVFPVVHGVRALGLEARIEETNTFERIQKLMQARVLDEQLGKDTAEALSYLMDLRLKAGFAALSNEIPEEANQIDLQSLSTLERDLLKDALQVVKRFKQMIHNHFHLGVR